MIPEPRLKWHVTCTFLRELGYASPDPAIVNRSNKRHEAGLRRLELWLRLRSLTARSLIDHSLIDQLTNRLLTQLPV